MYQIPCQDCDSVYIGETGRSLGKRIAERKYAVKTGDRKNGVAVHARDEGHMVEWEGAEILELEPHYLKRRVRVGNKKDQQEIQSGLWPCPEPDLNAGHSLNFSFPPIYHCHSAIVNQYLSTSTYISLVSCTFSSFS